MKAVKIANEQKEEQEVSGCKDYEDEIKDPVVNQVPLKQSNVDYNYFIKAIGSSDEAIEKEAQRLHDLPADALELAEPVIYNCSNPSQSQSKTSN